MLTEVAIGARRGRPLLVLSSRLRGQASGAKVGATLPAELVSIQSSLRQREPLTLSGRRRISVEAVLSWWQRGVATLLPRLVASNCIRSSIRVVPNYSVFYFYSELFRFQPPK